MSSDIQVFVKWKDQSIFAGEDVECVITFKNVAERSDDPNNAQTPHLRKQSRTAMTPRSESFSLRLPPNPFRNPNRRSYPIVPRKSPSHRISSSVSSPLIGSHSFPPPSTPRNGPLPAGHKHKRSVSILSIDSEGGNSSVAGDKTPRTPSQLNSARPARGHGRSASLQVTPRRYEGYEDGMKGLRSPIRGHPPTDSFIQQSPGGLRVTTDSASLGGPGSGAHSPIRPTPLGRTPGRRPQLPPIDFKFPPAPENETTAGLEAGTSAVPKVDVKDTSSLAAPKLPTSKVLSASSLSGSHRSSGEFYSVSNNSSETLQSEYTNYSGPMLRTGFPRHNRHMSSMEATPVSNGQALLMGYAQISASFTVDGSLVNQSAFDEVKRQGVVGGAGSGGTPNGRPSSSSGKSRKGGGFWGALNWNSIEESISGLLSNNELDGLREMRGVSSSKSIPLLSTPQSLLFVDLRLAPGEEQSFSFAFTLPSGLPASHKGKAIKISYNLVIGTQRPSGSNEPQKVNRISIPFRVFSGVNAQGNILGHDLMSPHVILRDEARVQKAGSLPSQLAAKTDSISRPTWTSAPEFLSYVDEILEQRSRDSSLKPPGTLAERRPSYDVTAGPLSCKDAIDFAILRSNQTLNSSQSPNRFEIARGGRRIAVVVLNRPAHRLGETLIATVNFVDSALPCYALRATLESSEKVGAHVAVRSSASIRRATRRVHASFFEITLYSTRVVFSPAVPISATPTILTSGVNVEWELRFEFVTTNAPVELGTGPSGARLLETVSEDDRGSTLSALEHLGCESFEVAIPITIYGETVRERLPEESEGYSI
ncbi:Rgp1-domain-containing protein [Aspergillus unguis]